MEHDQRPEENGLDPFLWVPRVLGARLYLMEEAPFRVIFFLCYAEQTVMAPPATLPRALIATGAGIGESRAQHALEVLEREGWVRQTGDGDWQLALPPPESDENPSPLRGGALRGGPGPPAPEVSGDEQNLERGEDVAEEGT
jgi:hypothetical protein